MTPEADARHMREFWDRRAREDAYFFVDDRRAYRDPRAGTFWADGERDLGRLLELLDVEIDPTAAVLDIGCGVGRLTRIIAARAERVYAIDVSGEMLERARRLNADLANVEWLLGDGRTLAPLGNGSVDACISHVVFQHIPDPRVTLGYIAEIGRVLRPGGWAAFQVSNDPRAHTRRGAPRGRMRTALDAVRRRPLGQDDEAWLGSAIMLPELRAVADANRLELERIVGEGTQFCLIRARRRQ
jgi:SAM-dependent methyltransferase